MDEVGFSRRALMCSGGAMVAGGMLASAAGATAALEGVAGKKKPGYDPRLSSAGQIKLEAYLDGRPAPWWYSGTIYAVRDRMKPKPLFHFEGCETYRATLGPSGDASCAMRTLTFFKDLETGAWIDAFDNPFTGKRNPIRPNVLKGEVYFPADGSPPRPRSANEPTEIAPAGYDPIDPNKPTGSYSWIVAGDMILRKGYRSAASRLQPAMECQATFGDSAVFFDPDVKSMGARFSSATFSPYLGWMGMPDEPGHLVWHAAGLKFANYGALPPEYVARAESVMPGALTAPI